MVSFREREKHLFFKSNEKKTTGLKSIERTWKNDCFIYWTNNFVKQTFEKTIVSLLKEQFYWTIVQQNMNKMDRKYFFWTIEKKNWSELSLNLAG